MTGRELDLGLLGLAEFAPLAVLAPLTGSLSDRLDRRKVLGVALVGEATASLLLFLYARSDPTSIGPIFAIVLLFGVSRAFAFPAGRALAIDLSPHEVVPRVIALKSVCFQAGHIAGPVTFGFVFVIPPVCQVPHEELNRRLPRFTCSCVKITVFDPSKATVRVASSRSIAKAAVAFKQARHEMLKITDFKNLRNIIFFYFFYKIEPNRNK